MNEISLRDGRRLAYAEHGAPHGTPIVHCHVNGTHGAVHDMSLIARPWGFDPATIGIPTSIWHGEKDANVPAAQPAIFHR